MSSREESVGPCMPAKVGRCGFLPGPLHVALFPLVRQFNAVPLGIHLRCSVPGPDPSAVCAMLGKMAGLSVMADQDQEVRGLAHLATPVLRRLMVQAEQQPGSIWVPDLQSLWDSLELTQKHQLMANWIRRMKCEMAPLAQRLRCFPAGLGVWVEMQDPDDEAVLDQIREVTGWDLWAKEIQRGRSDPGRPLAWQELLDQDEWQTLRSLLRKHRVKPLRMEILLAMSDPSDAVVRNQVSNATGLPVRGFQAEEEEIAAALREKVGDAQQDFRRQMACLPLFFKVDKMVESMVELEVLPLNFVLSVATTKPKDLLAQQQMRMLTGFDVEIVEMTGSSLAGPLQTKSYRLQ